MFLALITMVFFLSWTPVVLYTTLFDFFRKVIPERESMKSVFYAILFYFGLLTTIANPILYSSLNESFREAFRATRYRIKLFIFSETIPKRKCSGL